MKKIWSALLTLCLILALIPATAVTARAANIDMGTCGSGVEWSLADNGTLTISGEGAIDDYDESPFAAYQDTITSLVVEPGVTAVGRNAFAGLEKLTAVVLPNTVTAIGDGAFASCTELARIHLGTGLISLGDNVFTDDAALAEISFSGKAPAFGEKTFDGVTATVYYPKSYSSWLGATNTGYGGTITWKGVNAGWVDMADGRHYLIENGGYAYDRWVRDDERWYHIGSNGVMETGWQEYNGSRYYFDAEGRMLTGDQTIDGTSCTFDEFGRLMEAGTEQKPLSENYYTAKWAEESGQYLYVVTVRFTGVLASVSDEYSGLGLCPGAMIAEYASYLYTKDKSQIDPEATGGYYTTTYDGTIYYCYAGNGAIVPYEYLGDRVVISEGIFTSYPLCFAIENGRIVVEPNAYSDVLEPGDILYPADSVNPGWPPVLPDGELDPEWPAAPERMWGATRQTTAVAISRAAFPNGSDNVILASGDNYPDALAGGPLAYELDAPILLIRRSRPDQATLDEIRRLGAKNVYILGGAGVVSDAVADTMKDMGLTVERIAGANRFDTAVAVAEKLEALRGAKPTTVFFVYSHNYPDALAVSNVASLMGAPILYVDNTGNLRDSTAAYLKHLGSVEKAYIISGPGVIRPNADTAIGAFGPVQRIYGADRYETCTRINRTFADVLDGNSLCLACGTNYPDALAGSVFAAKYHAPMVLVRGGLTAEQAAYVKEKAPENVYAFGGTGVLPDSVLDAVKKAAR